MNKKLKKKTEKIEILEGCDPINTPFHAINITLKKFYLFHSTKIKMTAKSTPTSLSHHQTFDIEGEMISHLDSDDDGRLKRTGTLLLCRVICFVCLFCLWFL